MIKLDNIKKSYGSLSVLNGVDLLMQPGSVHGIVGRNGAGKSTLFSVMAGLIGYDGKLSSSWQPLHHHLSLLTTEPYILSKITGQEYLRFIQLAQNTEGDISRKNIFNLPLERYASTYSTGMKKKLAFTGLLMAKHDVILLDEPFNGVDIQSNIIIKEVIRRWRDMGKIVVISSHIFSALSDSCDKIHLLEEGKILITGEKGCFSKVEDQMKKLALDMELNNLELY